MSRVPSEIEYLFCQEYKIGDKVFSSELAKFYGDENRQSTGAKITVLLRRGIIKPLFRRGTSGKKGKDYDVCFERIK
jgi:hypothetical protein